MGAGTAPEMKRLGEGSAFGGGVGAFGGAKADTENMRRNPDLATAAAITAGIFGDERVGGIRDPPPLLNLGFKSFQGW
jgi:hypothetical protein